MKLPVGAKIIGVGSAVPAKIVTNADIEMLVDTSDEWIITRTGIRQRHVISPNESCSGLAIEAAKDALNFAGVDPAELDLIVVATSTPDNLYPSTACSVQAAIGARSAAAFDLEAACTGIIYALSVAQQFIGSGTYKTVLVIGADVHSRFLDWEDRNTCILFGDAAGAFVLQASDEENEMLGTYLRADGTGGHLLSISNRGINYPEAGTPQNQAAHRFLQMNGRAVYEFAVQAIPDAIKAGCTRAGIKVEDIDYLIPHQANQRIIKAAAERLGIDMARVIHNIDQYGNTSAASIPLAFSDAVHAGRLKTPSTIALVGFGGGLTWGSAVLRWSSVDQRSKQKDNTKVSASEPAARETTGSIT